MYASQIIYNNHTSTDQVQGERETLKGIWALLNNGQME